MSSVLSLLTAPLRRCLVNSVCELIVFSADFFELRAVVLEIVDLGVRVSNLADKVNSAFSSILELEVVQLPVVPCPLGRVPVSER